MLRSVCVCVCVCVWCVRVLCVYVVCVRVCVRARIARDHSHLGQLCILFHLLQLLLELLAPEHVLGRRERAPVRGRLRLALSHCVRLFQRRERLRGRGHLPKLVVYPMQVL